MNAMLEANCDVGRMITINDPGHERAYANAMLADAKKMRQQFQQPQAPYSKAGSQALADTKARKAAEQAVINAARFEIILDILRQGPQTRHVIGAALGLNETTAYKLLRKMEGEGMVDAPYRKASAPQMWYIVDRPKD